MCYAICSTPLNQIELFCASDVKLPWIEFIGPFLLLLLLCFKSHLGLRGLYIGPFGARAGKAEMTLEAVVTFDGGEEDEEGEDDGDDEDEDIDDHEVAIHKVFD